VTVLLPRYPALAAYLRKDLAEVRANYVTGDDEVWRKAISNPGQQRLWQAIPQNVKDFLALKP
jgi:hypothetical protein